MTRSKFRPINEAFQIKAHKRRIQKLGPQMTRSKFRPTNDAFQILALTAVVRGIRATDSSGGGTEHEMPEHLPLYADAW